jgi:hypothetical protein
MYVKIVAQVIVLVGLLTIWGTIYQRSLYPTASPVTAFDDQWDHAVEFPLEQMVISTLPKPIKTEIIILPKPEVKAPEVKAPEVKVVEAPKQGLVVAKPEPKKESNPCTRHRMHKVYTKDGRSWRCRK